MKYLTIILIVLLSGCVTQNKCLFKFPPPPPDTIIEHSVEWRDTTIYKYLPGEVVHDSVIIKELVEKKINIPYQALYAETLLAEATASIENNMLKLELTQRDSMFAFLLDSAIMASYDTITIKQPYIKEVPVKTNWQTFLGFGFWMVLGLFLFTLLFVILRK